MAIVRPFKAYRPQKSLVASIAAPPYDVVSSSEARELVTENQYSFLRIDRGEINLENNIDEHDEQVYETAKNLLNQMISEEIFVQESKPCFYIYRENMNNIIQTGLVMCASVEEYISNTIKRHENIRDDKAIDRINHIEACEAHTGPIFIIYRENQIITDVVNKWVETEPIYEFKSEDNILHTIWRIDNDLDIKILENAFKDVKDLYIADGHHRSSAAVNVAKRSGKGENDEINYFLSIAYPDTTVNVLEYNRTVKDLNGYSKEQFLKEVSKSFAIRKSENNKQIKPEIKNQFGMYLESEWYYLEAREEILKDKIGTEALDVSLLQNYLLSPILGIDDPTKSKKIDFIGGIRGIRELERRANTDMKVSFSLYPVSIDEIMGIADQGQIMPPKSTWFEPKPRSGIFIHKFK